MKLTPVKVSKLLSNLGDYITHRNESEIVNVNACFDDLFESVELNVDKALGLSAMKNSIDSHLHVGAFRKLPEETISKSLPVTAATTPWHNLLDNRYELRESKRPQNVVNSALKKLDVPYQVATRILHTVAYMPSSQKGENPIPVVDSGFTDEELVFQDSAGVPHPIQSLGSGIGVIVPVVVALSTTDTELLSIEEPECHIHPRLQAALGDIVIESSLGRKGTRTFIETHSEHLILRILRRIRETTEEELAEWPESLRIACPNGISSDDVAVLYVKPGSEDSSEGSTIIQLPITPDGDFGRPWPGGFFAERSKELF
jgi:hypothetical protein